MVRFVFKFFLWTSLGNLDKGEYEGREFKLEILWESFYFLFIVVGG